MVTESICTYRDEIQQQDSTLTIRIPNYAHEYYIQNRSMSVFGHVPFKSFGVTYSQSRCQYELGGKTNPMPSLFSLHH